MNAIPARDDVTPLLISQGCLLGIVILLLLLNSEYFSGGEVTDNA